MFIRKGYEIVDIEWRKNDLGFPHVICMNCEGGSFHVKTDEVDEEPVFYSLICINCSNEIFCNLQPVFGPAGNGSS